MSEDTTEPTAEEPEPEGLGIGELLAGIPEMDQHIADLQGAVERILEELANYPAGGPWLWEGLTPQAQRELWIELDAFVTWLQNRILCHHMSKDNWIPACWYKHPDVVEQLTALMVAHKASYHPKTKKPSHALVDWFHKCLWPTMDTLKQRMTLKQCLSKKEHDEPYMLGLNLVAGEQEFVAFVDSLVPEPKTPTQGVDFEASVAIEPASGSGLPPWMVDPSTGEIVEPPPGDEPPEPDAGAFHG